MFPKCLVFSDINIFIRTYFKKFLVFPISRFLRANTQWEYCLKIDPFLPKAGGRGGVEWVGSEQGGEAPLLPLPHLSYREKNIHIFFFFFGDTVSGRPCRP